MVEADGLTGRGRHPAWVRRRDRRGASLVDRVHSSTGHEESDDRDWHGRGLTPDRLDELMSLLQGADSVELKLTVPDADQRSAVRALEMDPLEAELRQVFFFDTPDLALNQHGVIVRARRTPRATTAS